MTEIPADVMEAAWACVDQYTDPDIVPVIARAIMTERERCAKIADDLLAKYDESYASSEFKALVLAGSAALFAIAAAIRA